MTHDFLPSALTWYTAESSLCAGAHSHLDVTRQTRKDRSEVTGCELAWTRREPPLESRHPHAEDAGIQPNRKADGRYKQPDGDE
jgi:hypothetical protein